MRTGLNTAVALLLAAVLALSCGSSPTGSDDTAVTSDLTVLVKDTAGYPIPGMQVKTYPETITLITDESGIVRFTEITPDDYQVVVSRSDIPVFYERIRVTNQPAVKLFEIAIEVTVNLKITHTGGVDLEGAQIFTSPPTINVIADKEGTAVMERIPVKKYTFIVNHDGAIAYVFDTLIIAKNGIVQDIDLVVEEQGPRAKIIAPTRNHYQSIFGVQFTGEGIDFEDGALSPESLVWSSDIDGYLGTGNDLFFDRMSIGRHTISLTAYDSTQREHTQTTDLVLYFYSKDSYFPIPEEGSWTFSNTPASFDGYFDGVQGRYELGDIQVTMVDVNKRETVMQSQFISTDPKMMNKNYDITYVTTDYLDNDIDQLFVTRTIEELSYQSTVSDNTPVYSIKIDSKYQDKYPLIYDHLDVSVGNDFTFQTTADVVQTFPLTVGTSQYREPTEVRSETSFEGFETITTPQGMFDTAKLRIVQGETERIWWLAKGYGIVQYSYNTMESTYTVGPRITATLTDTNLDEMQELITDDYKSVTARPAVDHLPDSPISDNPPPEELKQLMSTFRSLLPY